MIASPRRVLIPALAGLLIVVAACASSGGLGPVPTVPPARSNSDRTPVSLPSNLAPGGDRRRTSGGAPFKERRSRVLI